MRLNSEPIEEHGEVPLADDGRWEEIVSHWTQHAQRPAHREGAIPCYVVSVGSSREEQTRRAELAEILGLVRARGDDVVGHETLEIRRTDPRTLVGRGAAARVAERATESGAEMLVLDAELSPSQMRNLEDATGFSVCDREGVILSVFSRHARTRRARIQVEIAHLEYVRPRIRGLGLVMDQQAGGVMGSRGPGETASELLARHLDDRLAQLRRAFDKLKRSGETQRGSRKGCKRIALVGYTNAGKTTLMNGLTSARLSARDLPFETLDTTSRCLTRHGGDVLLSDTVGFIRRLPDRLLASFESTLAEAREANLLTVVVDVSDPEWLLHLETTDHLLVRLGAGELPRFYVFNKMDQVQRFVPQGVLARAAGGCPFAALSGHDRAAVRELRDALVRVVRGGERELLFVPYHAREIMAAVYGSCRVVHAEALEDGLQLTVEGETRVLADVRCRLQEVER